MMEFEEPHYQQMRIRRKGRLVLVQICQLCHHEIGGRDTHTRCHMLLFKFQFLLNAHPNDLLFTYWRNFDGYPDSTIDPTKLLSADIILREFRNILKPSQDRAKARKAEDMAAKLAPTDHNDHIHKDWWLD